MADHIRKQIRDAAATLLTGLTTTGTHVFKSRVLTLKDSQLPALTINTNSETIEAQTFGIDALQERRLELVVEARAKATAAVDDDLDTIIKEVEQAIFADETSNTLDGLVHYIALSSIEVAVEEEGDKKTGIATMTFTALYFNQASAPDVSV